jgi:hypothetical protein
MTHRTEWTLEKLTTEIERVMHDRDIIDVDRWRLCHGGARCSRAHGAPMSPDCSYCFVFFSDDKRTPAEIASAMLTSH